MFSRFVTYLGNTSRSVGVEILCGETNKYRAVELQRKGSTVTVVNHAEGDSPAAIKKIFSPGVPVYVLVSGKGILFKKVNAGVDEDRLSLIKKALPNAGEEEFYAQAVNGKNGFAFVSLARRSTIDALLEPLREAGAEIVGCSCGPAAGWVLAVYGQQQSIHISGYSIQANAEQLISVEQDDSEASGFIPGDEKISAAFNGAYALAFFPYATSRYTQTAQIETTSLEHAGEELRQKRVFRKSLGIFIAFLFCLMLGNYFLFQHYWERKNDLEQQVQRSGGEAERINALQQDVASKKEFLEAAGLLLPARHSYYADRLAAGVPASIQLTRLNLAPRQRTAREDSIAFHPGSIHLTGNCRQSTALNEWIGVLKNYPWIKSVTLGSYQQDKSQENGLFELDIETKP